MRILGRAFLSMAPLLLAALGGLLTELGGMLNIALEGLMALGAFVSVVSISALGSTAAGLLAGMAASMALAALMGLFVIRLKADPFIAALSVNLLAPALCALVSEKSFLTGGVVYLPRLPRLGFDWFPIAALALAALCQVVVDRTPFGVRLRAAGLGSEALRAQGRSPSKYRFAALLASGALSALGGAAFMLRLGAYVPNATAGRGWTALVVVFLGGRRPLGLAGAAFLFALADSLSNHLQGLWDIPADFILALPYILTLAAMVALSVWEKRRQGFGASSSISPIRGKGGAPRLRKGPERR